MRLSNLAQHTSVIGGVVIGMLPIPLAIKVLKEDPLHLCNSVFKVTAEHREEKKRIRSNLLLNL